MVFGTPFEKLEDEDRTSISKRPKGIQDEIVTDERGKRRFHGAFTGGFSAGYFNTVGTKHGWVPQTFKSSREDRAEKQQQAAEDFMDDEDLGEFGIAARKLRTKSDFLDAFAMPGEQRLLAWERASTTSSATGTGPSSEASGGIAQKLTEMLRPVSDSMGVRLLKKMGWRPGKGIGAKMTRRALERQKVIDASSAGRSVQFDEEAVREVEERLQTTAEFSPDDVALIELRPKEDVHGLGYKPLQESGVLSQKYGVTAAALKTSKKSKGIRGQAFGVGAFEEEDEDIYTNYDLSQYDFEVGASSGSAQLDIPKFDSTFVASSTAGSAAHRKFFVAPQPPPGWRPHHHRPKQSADAQTGQPLKLPEGVAKASERLTPFQRAKLLGERDHSVMEMLSTADRERLRMGENRAGRRDEEERRKRRAPEAEPFEEEPMKAHRFRQYVSYLKRGIPFPQPVDMTRLEWEREQEQFQEALTPELRALLPEVRDRQKPLAKIDFARPIAEHLKSRFEKETGAEDVKHHHQVKDERVEAVRTKQFGTLTRQRHNWYPHRDLCKRFNVPNPYPDSQLVGAPGLSRRAQKDYSAQYSLMDLGGLRDTAAEVNTRHRQHASRFDQKSAAPHQEVKQEVKQEVAEEQQHPTAADPGMAPIELLAAIFGDDDDEEEEEKKEEDEEDKHKDVEERQTMLRLPPIAAAKKEEQNGGEQSKAVQEGARTETTVVTVFDLVEDDDVYGPAMPPAEFLREESNAFIEQTTQMVITVESSNDEEENRGEERRSKKEGKKAKKEKKKRKKEKKAKKEKRKRRKEDSTSSSGSD